MAAATQRNALPVVAGATTGSVAYEAELEIAPTRLHDVEAWLPGHVAEILKLPGFQSVESFKLGETPDGWIRRKNVYRVASQEHLDHYLTQVAPEMSARIKASFGDSVRATRRMLVPAPLAASLPSTLPTTAAGMACMNCGTPLAGSHCHVCGQRHDPHLHSLWHFLREATENLTHADSRLWRTLWALVAKPGLLTREFIDGRRARYLPPFRLYLVISVAFFIALGASPVRDDFIKVDAEDAQTAAALDKATQELNQAATKLGSATSPSKATPADSSADVSRQIREEIASEVAAAARKSADAASAARTKAAGSASKDPASFCDSLDYGGPWEATVEPRLRAGCRKSVLDDGAALKSAMTHNMPRAMFVLLPLVAFFMLALYWHPRRYYVEHLLFFVHTHAALFAVLLVRILLGLIPKIDSFVNILDFALLFYIPWYLYKAMRRTYEQSRMRTAAKFVLLGFFYVALASLVAGFTVVYSVATL